MSKSTVTTVTTSDLRDWFNADPKRIAALPEGDRRTVLIVDGKYPRGRVAKSAVTLHNQRRRTKVYTTGATKAAVAAQQAEAARIRKAASDAGVKVGTRGPVSKAGLAAAGVKPKPAAKVRKG